MWAMQAALLPSKAASSIEFAEGFRSWELQNRW
jgi:hypothetical protein